jgi:hypothetical protein
MSKMRYGDGLEVARMDRRTLGRMKQMIDQKAKRRLSKRARRCRRQFWRWRNGRVCCSFFRLRLPPPGGFAGFLAGIMPANQLETGAGLAATTPLASHGTLLHQLPFSICLES